MGIAVWLFKEMSQVLNTQCMHVIIKGCSVYIERGSQW